MLDLADAARFFGPVSDDLSDSGLLAEEPVAEEPIAEEPESPSPLPAELEQDAEAEGAAEQTLFAEPATTETFEQGDDDVGAMETLVDSEGEMLSTESLMFDDEGPEIYTSGQAIWDASQVGCFINRSDLRFSTTVNGFKGPVDLDNQNGNFGTGFGVNGGFPLASRFGIGFQAGTGAVLSNFHGTQFTGDTIRCQQFTTLGLFHRVAFTGERLKYGFAFDWLNDNYYASIGLSQWRVKLGYEISPCSELGLLAMIPNDGDDVQLNSSPPQFDRMKPVAQGHVYHRRFWDNGITTTTRLGIVEEPGDFALGADANIPLSDRMSLVGGFNYVLPSASGAGGQDEEMWNVGIGIEFTTRRCGARGGERRFSPLFRLADNGIFNIRRY